MMHWNRSVTSMVVVLMLGFWGCNTTVTPKPPPRAIVHYIQFALRTFVPTTPENIEENARQRFLLDVNSGEFREIENALRETRAGTFDDEVVRLKIVLPSKEVILVDSSGGVRSSSGEKRLSESSFARLKETLRRLSQRSPDPG